jgi:hypothetical protein
MLLRRIDLNLDFSQHVKANLSFSRSSWLVSQLSSPPGLMHFLVDIVTRKLLISLQTVLTRSHKIEHEDGKYKFIYNQVRKMRKEDRGFARICLVVRSSSKVTNNKVATRLMWSRLVLSVLFPKAGLNMEKGSWDNVISRLQQSLYLRPKVITIREGRLMFR